MEAPNAQSNVMRLLMGSVTALAALGGVTFSMVMDRMDNQSRQAAADIATLREEIKATKSDAKDLVNTAAAAAKDAVANSATALRESVAATAAANKDSVKASADALQSAVTSTGISSKEAVAATASNLNEKIEIVRNRVDRLEDQLRANSANSANRKQHEPTP